MKGRKRAKKLPGYVFGLGGYFVIDSEPSSITHQKEVLIARRFLK
jgi:hypothetical protein